LKRHKPWLPQFKDHSGYDRFQHLIDECGIERASTLQKVWVDFEGDELILNGIENLLGPLDERYLTYVGLQIHTIQPNVNLRFLWADDYDATVFNFPSFARNYVYQLRRLPSLRYLSIYQFHARQFTVPCKAQNLEHFQIRMNGGRGLWHHAELITFRQLQNGSKI
jgi:hypothetical protein